VEEANSTIRFGRQDVMELRQHRHALHNKPGSIEKLSGNLKNVALQGRDLFLNKACHRSQHTDDGAKLMMALAFSRALQANNLSWSMTDMMVKQMTEVLKFPELDEQLKSVDSLGKSIIETLVTEAPKSPLTYGLAEDSGKPVSTSKLKVEIVDDTEDDIQILYSVPAVVPTRRSLFPF
jgi:hypothetical protein